MFIQYCISFIFSWRGGNLEFQSTDSDKLATSNTLTTADQSISTAAQIQRWMKGASWYILIPLIFILLFYVTLYYPCNNPSGCPIDLSHQLIGKGGDDFEWFGFMYLTKENILGLHHPFADTNIYRFPSGFGYSYGFDGAFAILVGAILGMIFPLIIAYNITILCIVAANMYISSFYFYKIGNIYAKTAPSLLALKSILAGVLFGLCPYVLTRLIGHLNLAFVPGFAALAWAFLNHFKKIQDQQPINHRDITYYLIAFLLLWIGTPEYVMFGALLLVPCLVVVAILKRKAMMETLGAVFCSKKELESLFVWTITITAITLFLFGGFFMATFSHSISVPWKFSTPVGTKRMILDLLAPKAIFGPLWYKFPLLRNRGLESAFIGLSGIFILLTYPFSKTTRKQTVIFLSIFIYILILISGILPFPQHTPQRFSILFMLLLSVAFMINEHLGQKFTMILLVILLLERCVLSVQVAMPIDLALIPPIENMSGSAIMTAPLTTEVFGSPHNVLPYFTHKKIVGGYFHWSANNPDSQRTMNDPTFGIFRCDGSPPEEKRQILEKMKSLDIRAISVDRIMINNETFDCKPLMQWLDAYVKDKSISLLVKGTRMDIYSLN
jgi:hypothetical protein